MLLKWITPTSFKEVNETVLGFCVVGAAGDGELFGVGSLSGFDGEVTTGDGEGDALGLVGGEGEGDAVGEGEDVGVAEGEGAEPPPPPDLADGDGVGFGEIRIDFVVEIAK